MDELLLALHIFRGDRAHHASAYIHIYTYIFRGGGAPHGSAYIHLYIYSEEMELTKPCVYIYIYIYIYILTYIFRGGGAHQDTKTPALSVLAAKTKRGCLEGSCLDGSCLKGFLCFVVPVRCCSHMHIHAQTYIHTFIQTCTHFAMGAAHLCMLWFGG